MNQKKAKAIRKALRASGTDPTEVRTEPSTWNFSQSAWFTGIRRLTFGRHTTACGRAIYQAAKKVGIVRAAT